MSEAVEELLDAQPQLRSFLLYQFGFSEHSAEDVLSGVRERWLRLLRDPSKAPEFPRTYLFALTRNAAVDHLRKASHRHEVLIDGTGWSALEPRLGYERSAEEVVADSFMNGDLLAKVRSLPHVQRSVIECLFIQDLSRQETAERLNISADSVQRNRLRALKTLRNMFVHAAPGTADKP
ncbi:RNA polymerase sigma factor [Streptomyces sp. NPDC059697]|uniref:RNA polymerase sigma factor n=1 Tax=Streptomyces sp. NPDC059697 TaxID=3346912 RepID=UPI0036CA1167